MNKITIQIRQLGAIKDSSITLSPVMFFSGESGLGKSYLAILCHYFFDVLIDQDSPNDQGQEQTRLKRFFSEERTYTTPPSMFSKQDSGIVMTFSKRELEDWLSKDLATYIRYILGHHDIPVDVSISLPPTRDRAPLYSSDEEDIFSFRYSTDLSGLDKKEELTYTLSLGHLRYNGAKEASFSALGKENPLSVLLRYYLMSMILGDFQTLKDSVILPPSRGACFTEELKAKTGLFEKFLNKIKDIDRPREFGSDPDEKVKSLFQEIIQGRIIKRNNHYHYLHEGGIELPLSAAASSIREVSPLSLIINRLEINKTALLFEEPEAHLHPTLQRKMADLLMLLAEQGMYMQITTHSDHLLRRINELMMLAELKSRQDTEEHKEFLKENQLSPSPIEKDGFSRIASFYLRRRQDGSSEILEQNISEGIPLQSFKDAVKESLRVEDILQEALGCDE
jgi:hypothetical protein